MSNNPNFITGLNNPDSFALVGNTLYVCGGPVVGTYNATTGAAINSNFITGLTAIVGAAVSSNILYLADFNNQIIRTFNATTGAVINNTFITDSLSGANSLFISGNTLYVSNFNNSTITTYNATTGATINGSFITTGLNNPRSIYVQNNYLYTANQGSGIVTRHNATTGAFVDNFITGISNPTGLSINGNMLYLTLLYNNTISQYDASTGNVINASFITGTNIQPFGLLTNNTSLYVACLYGQVGYYVIPAPPQPPCFLEGTKILTDKGYISIENLRKGDLVQTINDGYKAINMIGFRDIKHPGIKDRIKDQLYKCSKEGYPEVFEDLIITGCHSILVDDFIENQREQTKEVLGRIFVTDKKYRLPACIDKRCSVYEKEGTYTIYHLALENDDYYMNYGIYANGLLVETCSRRYLRELSNMTLIEE